MKVMLGEYSVCSDMSPSLQIEGWAMLNTLKKSFESAGCTVIIPGDLDTELEKTVKSCDCGLVIAPDDILEGYTSIVERNCINLGSPSKAVRICADKVETTNLLHYNGVHVPRIIKEEETKCVVKPRYGCGSEGVFISPRPVNKEGYISTEFIEGDHLSVTLIRGRTTLPLTLNKQHIKFDHEITYDGNEMPYYHPAMEEILEEACKAGEMLGCKGIFGVDIVYGDYPYVVDVNPRPTTAVLGVSKIMEENVADLIIKARFGDLPDSVHIKGRYSFTKKDLKGDEQ